MDGVQVSGPSLLLQGHHRMHFGTSHSITAMAALTKSISEGIRPGVGIAQADCGPVVSEEIEKVERLLISP